VKTVNKLQPRYLSISEELLSDIGAGKFPVGSMLPTELELCERFEVSRFTVREALRRLHEMGLLHALAPRVGHRGAITGAAGGDGAGAGFDVGDAAIPARASDQGPKDQEHYRVSEYGQLAEL
jgi:GntR family transcriptional regulator